MNALALAGSDRSLVATPATERRKRERSLSRFRCDSRGEENKMTRILRTALIFMATLTILVHPPFLTPARAAGPQDRVQQTLTAVSAVLQRPGKLQGADGQPERRETGPDDHLRHVLFRRDGPGVPGASVGAVDRRAASGVCPAVRQSLRGVLQPPRPPVPGRPARHLRGGGRLTAITRWCGRDSPAEKRKALRRVPARLEARAVGCGGRPDRWCEPGHELPVAVQQDHSDLVL